MRYDEIVYEEGAVILCCNNYSRICLVEPRKIIKIRSGIVRQGSKHVLIVLTSTQACEFLGFCSSVVKFSVHLGCDTVSTRRMEN
jgi:hypothetical protein